MLVEMFMLVDQYWQGCVRVRSGIVSERDRACRGDEGTKRERGRTSDAWYCRPHSFCVSKHRYRCESSETRSKPLRRPSKPPTDVLPNGMKPSWNVIQGPLPVPVPPMARICS